MRTLNELRQLVDMGWRVHWWRQREDHAGVIRSVYHLILFEPGESAYHGKGQTHAEAYKDAMGQYVEFSMPAYEVKQQ